MFCGFSSSSCICSKSGHSMPTEVSEICLLCLCWNYVRLAFFSSQGTIHLSLTCPSILLWSFLCPAEPQTDFSASTGVSDGVSAFLKLQLKLANNRCVFSSFASDIKERSSELGLNTDVVNVVLCISIRGHSDLFPYEYLCVERRCKYIKRHK